MFRKSTLLFVLSLLFVVAVASVAGAEEGAAAAPAAGGESNVKMVIALAAGFGIAIASFGGAISQAKAIAAGLEGIARNPSAQNKIFIPMIVGLALIESLVIYTLVIAFVLVGKL
jgi:F-type H+-transporting ATPase subunit c